MAASQRLRETESRPRVLCVDDEPYVLEGLRDALYRSFEVHTATGGSEGLEVLQQDPDSFAVVVSDMRMPGMSGIEFLRATRSTAPDATRMLLTGTSDVQAAVRAVNHGQLFRFLTKPCDSQELMRACAAALGQHNLRTADRLLLKQTVQGSVEALVDLLELANPSLYGRGGRLRDLAGSLARAAGLRTWWEVEVAAMLVHVGAVALPQATLEKVYAGVKLTEEEAAMVSSVPLVTRKLISKIPRLDGVLEILDSYKEESPLEPGDSAGEPVSVDAQVMRIAVAYSELEAQHCPATVALGAMRDRGSYDRGLLDLFARVVDVDVVPRVREISVAQLEPGMVLADDARGARGGLLFARGQEVTERLIEQLSNLGPGGAREPLRIFERGGAVPMAR